MLKIEHDYFQPRISIRSVAKEAGIEPETLSRIIHGKQKPSLWKGGSGERIAAALGYDGPLRELFEPVEPRGDAE